LPIKGTRKIHVILYAKDDPFCAPAPADELWIEDVLAVEHNVIPLDGADVFQKGEIDSIGDRVALTQDPGGFARLPVDDTRQDQVQAAAGVHLFPQLAGVDPAAPPVKDTCRAAQNLPRSGWSRENITGVIPRTPRYEKTVP
jgi:hypothetical protein